MTSDEALRAEHTTTAARALAAISRLDIPAVLAETHPDLVMELPYERAVAPMDRERFGELLTGLAGSFQRFSMEIVEVIPALDPSTLVIRYDGDCLSNDGSVTYRNNYIAIMNFTDGLISRWREYDNPVISRKMNERLAAVGT
ncbi:MAG TPA: nuclear transport factor 2 family protein [Pseudonocardia sp.]|jgi:ketosteroid isomerase-like protein|nr:nuclear transport factor 2 family protein [Pseudonocardia sp.]